MGWLGWGLYAARRMSRSRRREPFFYTNILTGLLAEYLVSRQQKTSPQPTSAGTAKPREPGPVTPVSVPAAFERQASWTWSAEDLEYYRYATERWQVFVCERWGVLELPQGSSAAYNFFGITRLHQEDERGALAHGASAGGDMKSTLPLLVLFRLTDGYNDAFAAVQSWSLVQRLIEQDRPLEEAGNYPRATIAD